MSDSQSAAMGNIIPMPVLVQATGQTFTLSPDAGIYVQAGNDELLRIGQYLADKLNPATGYATKVIPESKAPAQGNIYLTTEGSDATLGDEGYALTVAQDGVTLVANKPAGLFRGIQTIRQMLPPAIDNSTVQPGPWTMATGTIRDYPRFEWRGAMLDVARHFFKVDDVKRYIDTLAYYKLNRFHLHLADDQGWRIEIKSWPKLATYGGSTEVGGGSGGYYTQAEYADLVAYAQSRYITVIPEIDMPGHVNAAQASYPELNCNGTAPDLYTSIDVGFSSLCIDSDMTYKFVDDVIKELAALTPGPYIHIGGDEARSTPPEDYKRFIERIQPIVESHGKQMVGWEEIGNAKLLPTAIAQDWNDKMTAKAVQQGAKVIISSATKAYMDMKYDPSTTLGLNWAGYTDVQTAYDWDPTTREAGVTERDILGVEAPLWSETLQTLDDINFMTFPRLPGYAEIGWSPATGRSWSEYSTRLAAHGPRWAALGVNFFRSSDIPWK